MKKNITLEYYDTNANELIQLYNSAKVEELHALFLKYIHKNDKVLDIGFGSGRDLKEIMKITPNIFGLDACEKFIHNAENINGLKARVAQSVLPEIHIEEFNRDIAKFDVIVSIAVFMHLNREEIEQTIEKMKSIMIKNGVVIISYSINRQHSDDERHFESLNQAYMVATFRKFGFTIVEEIIAHDGLDREIRWVTQIFRGV